MDKATENSVPKVPKIDMSKVGYIAIGVLVVIVAELIGYAIWVGLDKDSSSDENKNAVVQQDEESKSQEDDETDVETEESEDNPTESVSEEGNIVEEEDVVDTTSWLTHLAENFGITFKHPAEYKIIATEGSVQVMTSYNGKYQNTYNALVTFGNYENYEMIIGPEDESTLDDVKILGKDYEFEEYVWAEGFGGVGSGYTQHILWDLFESRDDGRVQIAEIRTRYEQEHTFCTENGSWFDECSEVNNCYIQEDCSDFESEVVYEYSTSQEDIDNALAILESIELL